DGIDVDRPLERRAYLLFTVAVSGDVRVEVHRIALKRPAKVSDDLRAGSEPGPVRKERRKRRYGANRGVVGEQKVAAYPRRGPVLKTTGRRDGTLGEIERLLSRRQNGFDQAPTRQRR